MGEKKDVWVNRGAGRIAVWLVVAALTPGCAARFGVVGATSGVQPAAAPPQSSSSTSPEDVVLIIAGTVAILGVLTLVVAACAADEDHTEPCLDLFDEDEDEFDWPDAAPGVQGA